MSSNDQLRIRARKLIASANELLAIAYDLEKLCASPGEGEAAVTAHAGEKNAEDRHIWSVMARRAYADRRRRSRIFDPELFGEPAWDLLLDLFIAAKENKRVSVTSACIGADVPSTTALRWIAVLESHGLVSREDDSKDGRRAFIHLTADAYARMIDYFAFEMPWESDESVEAA